MCITYLVFSSDGCNSYVIELAAYAARNISKTGVLFQTKSNVDLYSSSRNDCEYSIFDGVCLFFCGNAWMVVCGYAASVDLTDFTWDCDIAVVARGRWDCKRYRQKIC